MNTTDPIILRSLIPITASNITLLDILLPPLLLLSSLLLYIVHHETSPIGNAHIYRMRTTHARYLPKESKHAFSYSTVFFGFDLRELESRTLDLSRLFMWNAKVWSVFSITASDYLDKITIGKETGIRERLNAALRANGVDADELESVYMVTMPGYLGFHGINPLTVYFGYARTDESKREMKIVVLEVHNTFEERHLYYLEAGKHEDTLLRDSYSHQWTFPRSFHVSPFNDRSGYYQVSLIDPLREASSASPYFAIKILLLTADTKEKKLLADLKGCAVPFSESSALSAIVNFPLSLFLTTPRILYQAAKLHYKKHLDVFPKPEPFSSRSVDGLHLVNPVQEGGLAGNVLWQPADSTMTWVKEKLVKHLQSQVQRLADEGERNISVRLISTDASESEIDIQPSSSSSIPVELLEIIYASSYFFVDLLMAPSPELAVALGMQAERRWVISNKELFCVLLSSPLPNKTTRAQWMRCKQVGWSLSFAPNEPDVKRLQQSLGQIRVSSHFLDKEEGITKTVLGQVVMQRIAVGVFGLTRARFIKGLEPWSEWTRAAKGYKGRVHCTG